MNPAQLIPAASESGAAAKSVAAAPAGDPTLGSYAPLNDTITNVLQTKQAVRPLSVNVRPASSQKQIQAKSFS